MNILELDSYNLADAVKFHDRLNHRLWDRSEHLHPQVHAKLMEIAQDFQEFLGVPDLDVKDITISGSNSAYNYTPNSDIDLHLVVDLPEADSSEVYRELFDAKKFQYNAQHNIKISGYDVELYVQNPNQEHHSQGIYSLLRNAWVSVPKRKKANIDDISTRSKYEDLVARIDATIGTGNYERLSELMKKIRAMRQSGLEQQGEFGADNLAFKLLRNNGYIKRLVDTRNAARDVELSLAELARPKQRVQYGFMNESPDGVNPTTKMFLEQPEDENEITVREFIDFVVDHLGINDLPEIVLHNDPAWSKQNHSFGRYTPEMHTLEVNLANRHIMDVLRTTAHELVHCKQNQEHALPDQAGDTGSDWENEANAMAGVIMRDYAEHNPRMFENASGYIPRNKREARDPRYSMAVSVDIKPGQVGKEANKLNLKTDRQGHPQIANPNGLFEQLAAELESFKQQDLFEINMGSKNLRREAAKTGAIAGMEFEMIVPNVEGGDGDEDLEPDYEYDQRCRSIQDAYDFFYDGDWNSRRSCDAMRDSMRNDFTEWLDEKISSDWDSGGEEYIVEWVKNNVDESEWNPDDLVGEARNGALEEYATNVHADPVSDQYQSAYEEFREENQESYDESDWLDDADLSRMSEIENAYSMSWPHYSSGSSGGEAEISDVAQEFENAIGRDVRASDNYHSGNTLRPSVANQRYIVEPDGSLESDNPGDRGLEFVSPPLPIDEILGDLNKVRAWAKEYGCYTNDSTGLHINISVPNYSRENLDFVKLALLMGDKYVLSAFGRSSNTYAKSALDIVKKAVRDNPDNAAKLLDKMKGNLDQLASKAIHSGITSKYTSINTKDGHIEFRSPGGDWLDQNFDQIENTLLRFTVAMSAALNPDAYRQEYLTKLYKLLSENNKGDDTIKYFSDYVAGKIPKAALRSFVKQAQLQRNIKRGKTDGQKMWWKVYKDGKNAGRYGAMIEVVATSEKEAIDKAAKEWGLFSQEYKSQMDAEALRPFKETGPMLGNRPSNPDGNYVIINQANPTKPVYRYQAVDANDGLLVLRQWISANPGTQWTFKHDPDQRLGQPGAPQTGTGTYELFDRRTGEAVPDTEFSARNQADVNTRLDDYINFGPHRISTVDARLVFGARPVADSGDADQGPSANSLRPTGPGPWEIYNRATGNSVMNLMQNSQPITDRAQAQRFAMALISTGRHDLYGVRTVGTDTTTNIGTQTDMENRLGLPSQSATANYAVVDRQTLDPVFRFQADDLRAANRIYGEWLAATGLPATTEDYGFQEIRPGQPEEAESSLWAVRRISDDNSRPMGPTLTIRARDEQAARDLVRRDYPEYEFAWLDVQPAEDNAVPEVPMDVAQNFPDRTDGRNIDYSFRDLFGNTDQASSAPAGNSFSGQWKVMIDGEEVYRFGGIGNNQGDANRVGRDWVLNQIRNRRLNPADGADIEILPIMGEAQ